MKMRCVRKDWYDVAHGRPGHDYGVQSVSSEGGVWKILKWELAYGGKVTSFSDDGMTVVTPVLGKTDITSVVFETTEDRDMMSRALAYWYNPSRTRT